MFDLMWWHWAIVGFGFILAELVLPAFVLVWFGLGGLLVMLSMLVKTDLSLTAQLTIWTLSSLAMMGLWFRVFKRGSHKILVGRSSASLVGEIGLVAESVAPFKQGRVRFQKPFVGSDIWDCMAEEEIAQGERVQVVSVEGNKVLVKKLSDKK